MLCVGAIDRTAAGCCQIHAHSLVSVGAGRSRPHTEEGHAMNKKCFMWTRELPPNFFSVNPNLNFLPSFTVRLRLRAKKLPRAAWRLRFCSKKIV